MSYKSSWVKIAINKTPTRIILWLANKKLKGIAKLTNLKINTNEGMAYVQILLTGEDEPIELWLEELELIANEEPYKLVVKQVRSSKVWLEAFLTKAILGREWEVPESQSELIWKLFASRVTQPEDE